MRSAALAAALATAALCASVRAEGEADRRDASIGYAYPAGGRAGTSFEVLVGGQNLRGASDAFVSGEGVTAHVLRHVPPLSFQQMGELRRRLAEAARGRPRALRQDEDPVELPAHPLFESLELKSKEELRAIGVRFLGAGQRRQPNRQIGETVEVLVTIAADAAPGERELRLVAPAGVTNPLRFRVGSGPEVTERETFEDELPGAPTLATPVLVNGQILPGDCDRFRFRASLGERLVIETSARALVPYLADAVPGWFQAVATVRDAAGRELAACDEWRCGPDPVLLFQAPAEGEYVLEVRDSLWRGREDFVYRVSIGPQPYVTRAFPLGASAGTKVVARAAGWNLGGDALPLDTAEGPAIRTATARRGPWRSNPVAYSVDPWPSVAEAEPNDDARAVQPLAGACVVDGLIAAPGDADEFAVEGRAGEDLVAEVTARRLGSPLDSRLAVLDAAGRTLAWNDDHDDPAAGLVTHQADSYVRVTFPVDGLYRVRLTDAQRHGGPEFAYRLRVGPPRPSFDALVTPSSLEIAAGRCESFRVRVVRRDGFDGDVAISLAGAPPGFALAGATVPAGRDSARITLAAPPSAQGAFALRLEATATVGRRAVRREVAPADDRMQAFAYRHLVPAQEFFVFVRAARRDARPVEVALDAPVALRRGGTALVPLRAPGRAYREVARLEIESGPAGVTLAGLAPSQDGFVLTLRAAADSVAGPAENLIVRIVDPAAPNRARAGLGVLPAIPVVVLD